MSGLGHQAKNLSKLRVGIGTNDMRVIVDAKFTDSHDMWLELIMLELLLLDLCVSSFVRCHAILRLLDLVSPCSRLLGSTFFSRRRSGKTFVFLTDFAVILHRQPENRRNAVSALIRGWGQPGGC